MGEAPNSQLFTLSLWTFEQLKALEAQGETQGFTQNTKWNFSSPINSDF